MLAFSSALLSSLACRFHSRAELELEVIALRHQLAVLRRQRPGRTRLSTFDRILWIWLYRVWPRCLNIMSTNNQARISTQLVERQTLSERFGRVTFRC
jgi:hypothetical protein